MNSCCISREVGRFHRLGLTLCLILGVVSCDAAPGFANVFGDHAVLQRGASIQVWGNGASAPQDYALRFGDLVVPVASGVKGDWAATLPAMPAHRDGRKLELLENGAVVAELEDIVVGEVWLAAGQSNMQFPVRGMLKLLPEAKAWVDSADVPAIRFRRVNDAVLPDKNAMAVDVKTPGGWTPMSPNSVVGFSAVASVFAREVEARLDAPIGIIDVSWGGKPIEPFIPRDHFKTTALETILELADAAKLDELARTEGGLVIRNPQGHPGAIYNARMAPFEDYALRGFLWYQAESNAGKGEDPRLYREKMKAMAAGWRNRWGDQQAPIYFVQLPSFAGATGWVRMREEQRLASMIPNTGMAVTIDIRGAGIHPPDKISVGRRLAALALGQTYQFGRSIFQGPSYRSHEIEGDAVHVRFDNVGGGLMVGDKPGIAAPIETPGASLKWFELAGRDGVWRPASAEIRGDAVTVRCPQVESPVAVRYACSPEPQGGNLYNREGYPASPFVTDLEMLPWEDHGRSR